MWLGFFLAVAAVVAHRPGKQRERVVFAIIPARLTFSCFTRRDTRSLAHKGRVRLPWKESDGGGSSGCVVNDADVEEKEQEGG